MHYQIKIAGKIFEGSDPRTLLKRAVEAKRGIRQNPIKLLTDNHLARCTKSMQNAENPDSVRD